MEKRDTTSYFCHWKLQKIYQLTHTNIEAALDQTKLYVEKYPNDIFGKIHLCFLLYSLEMPEYDNYIFQIEKEFLALKLDQKDAFRYMRAAAEINLGKLRYFFKYGRYQEAYQCYLEFKSDYDKRNKLYGMGDVLQRYVGVKNNDTEFENYYFYKQIWDYSEERFLEHIKKHEARYSENKEAEELKGLFYDDFPTNEIIEEIKKIIPNKCRILEKSGEDIYFFKYDNCGKNRNSITDYFALITIHNTHEFITMYPTTDINTQRYTDLNYLNKSRNVQKSISAIDRFNARLARKKSFK